VADAADATVAGCFDEAEWSAATPRSHAAEKTSDAGKTIDHVDAVRAIAPRGAMANVGACILQVLVAAGKERDFMGMQAPNSWARKKSGEVRGGVTLRRCDSEKSDGSVVRNVV